MGEAQHDPRNETLDDLDTEVIEDLDAAEDAEDVRAGRPVFEDEEYTHME